MSSAARPNKTLPELLFLFDVCQETFDAIKLVQTPAPSSSPTPVPEEDRVTRVRGSIPLVLSNSAGIDAKMWTENAQGVRDILDQGFKEVVEEVLEEMNLERMRKDRKGRRGRRMTTTTVRKRSELDLLEVEDYHSDEYDELHEDEEGDMRRLELAYVSSWMSNFQDVDCPSGAASSVECQSMDGNVQVDIIQPEDRSIDDIISAVTSKMEADGILRDGSSGIGGVDVFVNVMDDDTETIKSRSFVSNRGAFYGTLTGAAAVTILAAAFLYRTRRVADDNKSTQDGLGASPPHGHGTSVYSSRIEEYSSMNSSVASDDDYIEEGRKLRYGQNKNDLSLDGEGSSNAGSSGWSSSAGVSSIHTGSVDSMEYTFGNTLASIGAASGLHNKYRQSGMTGKKVDEIYSVGVDDDLSMGSDTIHSETSGISTGPEIKQHNATRKELNQAIDAGDWAAVGATAALLAQNSDTRSISSYSQGSGVLSANFSTSANSTERARAEELDHLMDTGDWEGVVLAAAKFEAEADKQASSSQVAGSVADRSMSNRSMTASSVATSSVNSPSVSTSVSESPSNAQRLAEIRREVEALVRRVVPDEIDNVDEMMNQFSGREEELVETLRTMQERSISRRAKEAVRKNAKREARKNAKSKVATGLPPSGMGLPPSGPKAGTPTNRRGIRVGSASLVSGTIDDPSLGSSAAVQNSLSQAGDSTSDTSRSKQPSEDYSGAPRGLDLTSIAESSRLSSAASPDRVALDKAIEAGDWEAVGEVASRMYDADSSVGTSDYESAFSGKDSFVSSSSRVSSSDNSQNLEDRSKELERLIEKGDWSGVVAAAGRYSVADKNSPTSLQQKDSGASSSMASSSEGKKGSPLGGFFGGRREQEAVTQEEKDALAQAELWMKIAAQSKTEGSSAKGASDAADWAISRSLNAMRNAEELREKSKKSNVGNSAASDSSDNSV